MYEIYCTTDCSEFEVDAKEAKLDKAESGPCHFEVLERVSTLSSSNLTRQSSNKSLRVSSTYLLSVLYIFVACYSCVKSLCR